MDQSNDRPPLRRSRDDRIIAGVCGGLGASTGVDPMIFRIGFAILTIFFFGTGVVLYGAAWLLIKDEEAPRTEGERIVDEIKTRVDDFRATRESGDPVPGSPSAPPEPTADPRETD